MLWLSSACNFKRLFGLLSDRILHLAVKLQKKPQILLKCPQGGNDKLKPEMSRVGTGDRDLQRGLAASS